MASTNERPGGLIVYQGRAGETSVSVLELDPGPNPIYTQRGLLNPRNDVIDHSPDGFAWGYAGSGPGQLALALCIDVTGNVSQSLRIHQDFKRQFVQHLPMDEGWVVSQSVIRPVIEHLIALRSLEQDNADAPQAAG